MSQALDTWKQKLDYLQQQEAIIADPAQKFALMKQIEEAQAKIVELSKAEATPSSTATSADVPAAAPALREVLQYNLITRSSMSDIEMICFDLNIDDENIDGSNKGDKARNLIRYLEQRGQTHLLIAWGKKNRPELRWEVQH